MCHESSVPLACLHDEKSQNIFDDWMVLKWPMEFDWLFRTDGKKIAEMEAEEINDLHSAEAQYGHVLPVSKDDSGI